MVGNGVNAAGVSPAEESGEGMEMEQTGVGIGDALQLATRANTNDDGGLGLSGMGLVVLLFVILLACGGGFFGNGRGGAQPVTESDLCNANSFSELKNSVGRMSDEQAAIARQTDNAIANFGYETLRNFNTTQTQALEQANATQRQLADGFCTTQRAIDAASYAAAQNTASINATTTAQTQRVLDALNQNKTDALQARVSQLELQQATSNVVRYPTTYAYSAGANPFCGGGTCCGASF